MISSVSNCSFKSQYVPPKQNSPIIQQQNCDSFEKNYLKKLSFFQRLKLCGKNIPSLKTPIGLDKETVNHLETVDINTFFMESLKIIAKAFDIPEMATPPVIMEEQKIKNAKASYNFITNQIFISPKVMNSKRRELFGMLAHEMYHSKQNLQILRTEGLNQKAVEEYAKLYASIATNATVTKITEMDEESFKKFLSDEKMEEDERTFFKKIRTNKCTDEVKEIYITYKNDYLKQLKVYIEKLIKLKGTLPKDNVSVANEYLAEFIKDYGKAHYLSLSEIEAYTKQYFAYNEYGKFLK